MVQPAYSTEVMPQENPGLLPGTQNVFQASSSLPPSMAIPENRSPGSPTGGFPPMSASAVPFTLGGANRFQSGMDTLKPSVGLSPEIQQTLDIIRKNQDYAADQGMSAAQALAVRRGVQGSSIEQFGTQSANEAASRAAQDSISKVLLQQVQNAHENQLKQADAYFARAAQEGTLTSDEIASQRNILLYQQQLELQKMLGTQANQIAGQNIDAQKKIASDQQRNGLIQTGASIAAPYILPKLFGASGVRGIPGTGGGLPGTAGVSALGPGGSGPGGIPYAGAGQLAGPGGSLLNTAGTSTIGAGSVAGGLVGYEAGRKTFAPTQEGDHAAENTGAIVGGVGGAAFGPGGSAVGAFVGTAAGKAQNRLVNGVEHSLGGTAGSIARYANPLVGIPAGIKKIFGGGSHTDTKGSDAWMQNRDPNEVAKLLGTAPQYNASYDSNKKGSAVENFQRTLKSFTPEQLVARYSAGVKTTDPVDSQYKSLYDQGVKMAGRPLSPEEMTYMLSTAA